MLVSFSCRSWSSFLPSALLLVTIAADVSHPTRADELVGTLPGEFSVDNKGSANYTLPLALPPGRSAMAPKLSINYNSAGGNGVLGLGFSLATGYPESITRGRSILARDGVVRGVTFTIDDKFYLDGKRLICVSEVPYGAPGSVYRTEVDSFVRIEAAGTGSGPSDWNIDRFVLTDKNGVEMVFGKHGTSVDGYQQGGDEPDGRAYAYALKRVTDVIGNYVEFSYADVGNGEYVLSSVKYSGNAAQPIAPRVQVDFTYNATAVDGSSDRRDASSAWIALRRFSKTKRLDRIDVSIPSESTTTATYTLGYDYGINQGRTRLRSVSAQLRDPESGAMEEVRPTLFEWSDNVISYTTTPPDSEYGPYAGYFDPDMPEHYAFGDVDGDGRDDCIWFGDTVHVQLSSGNSLASGTVWYNLVFGARMWKLADVNGDGRKDIIAGKVDFATGQCFLYCLVSTGTSFVPLGGGSFPTLIYSGFGDFKGLKFDGTPGEEGQFADYRAEVSGGLTTRIAVSDFTGDGRDDIVIHRFDGKLNVIRNEGASFSSSVHDIGARAIYATTMYKGWIPNVEFLGMRYVTVGVSMIPCELNGDGITDYAWSETFDDVEARDGYFAQNQVKAYWAVTSQPGGGFSTRTSITGHIWSLNPDPYGEWHYRLTSHIVMPADANGDGLTDFTVLMPDYLESVPGQPLAAAQFYLRHFIFLSKGASGAPQFESRNPLPTGVWTVDVGGEQEHPWFDKMPYSVFYPEYSGVTLSNAIDGKRKVVGVMGTSAGDGVDSCDVNRDGKDDYVWYVFGGSNAGWWVMYNQSAGYSQPEPAPLGWLPPDRIDQVYTQYNGVYRASRMALDMNGDGIKDYAYTNHFVREAPQFVGFHLSAAQSGDRVERITSGVGSVASIAYKPITDDAIYTQGTVDNPATASVVEGVTYPIRELRNATYVVADLYKDSGSDDPEQRAHFSYQYSGNRLDLSGRGPLGFHSFITLDRQTNLFKYQFLTQSFPMTGLTAREQTYRYWPTGSGSSSAVNFRAISSHDNTVVFDEVVKSPVDATPWGTVYPFISQAVESRWEDSTTAHFIWAKEDTPESKPELLFGAARPDGAHITVSAQSWFDKQDPNSPPQTTIPGGYYASDRVAGWTSDGGNLVKGSTSYADFHALAFPRAITYGNLTQLKTDFGEGFTERVVTFYKSVTSNGLSGLVEKVVTSVTSPGYGTEAAPEYAPDKLYTYWQNGTTPTSLVATETIDADRDGTFSSAAPLDLRTTTNRDSLGRVTATAIEGYVAAGATDDVIGSLTAGREQHIGSFTSGYVTSYDAKWDLPTSIDNAEGYQHTTTTQYHALLGLPTSVTDAENGTTSETQYDAMGRAIRVTDKNLKVSTGTEFAWTTTGGSGWKKTQTVSAPDGHTGAASGAPISGVSGISVSSAYATEVKVTLEGGEDAFKPITWTYFDRLGRTIRVVRQTQAGTVQTDTAYNSLGQAVAVTNPYNPADGSTGPFWTKTSYDALGRVAAVVAPNETVTTNTYIGRVTKVAIDAPNLGGVDPAAQTNATLVDYKGRTVKVWNADNIPGSFDPVTGSGQEASVEYVLDGFGRMRATKLRGQTQPITATYDAHGRQTSLNDPDKGLWTYLNNALGHVVRQADAKQTVTRTTFDRLGRQLTRETREASSGPVETADWYYYDVSSDATLHLVAKTAPTEAQPGGWIGAPQRDELHVAGAPGYVVTGKILASDPDTSTTIYYDPKGRPAITLTTADAKWFYTYTTYDSQYPRVKQVRHYWRPPGHELAGDLPYLWKDWGYNYEYDGLGYLTTVDDTARRTWWSGPTYDHLDRVISVKKGENTWTNRVYRPRDGMLTAIQTGTAAGTANVQNLSFQFDGLGNLTKREVPLDSARSETFRYDELNRLTTLNDATIATYAGNGNILSKVAIGATTGSSQSVSSYVYGGTRPHAVTSVSVGGANVTMTYDANGNVETRSNASNGEVWAIRMAGFDKPRWMAKTVGSEVVGSEFLYNANRSRVLHLEFDEMSAGAPSHYVRKRVYGFAGNFELNYANAAGVGVTADWKLGTIRIYVPGPDGNVGTMEFKANAPFSEPETDCVYHYDHLGSIEVITHRDSGVIAVEPDTGLASRFSYDAWGQRRNTQTWSGPPLSDSKGGASAVSPRGYTGHEMLDDLGLVHMNGRIYDPLIGRMLSADILVQAPGNLQAFNRYSYVFNNPLSFTDPSGYAAEDDEEEIKPVEDDDPEVVTLQTYTVSAESLKGQGYIAGGTVSTGGRGLGEFFWSRDRLFRLGLDLDSNSIVAVQQSFITPSLPTVSVAAPQTTAPSIVPPQLDPADAAQVASDVVAAAAEEVAGAASIGRQVASIVVDTLPFAGVAKGIIDFVAGKDVITGEKASRTLLAVGLVTSFVPGGKLASKALSKIRGASGVYEYALSRAGKRIGYIGQSGNMYKRMYQHLRLRLKGYKIEKAEFFHMPGSGRTEREIYEQYRILNHKGELLNDIQPMGNRMGDFFERIDAVIEDYVLPD